MGWRTNSLYQGSRQKRLHAGAVLFTGRSETTQPGGKHGHLLFGVNDVGDKQNRNKKIGTRFPLSRAVPS